MQLDYEKIHCKKCVLVSTNVSISRQADLVLSFRHIELSCKGTSEIVGKVQRKFLYRVERRCEVTRDFLALPRISEVLEACDISYLRKIIGNDEILGQLFDLRIANTWILFLCERHCDHDCCK